MTRSGGHPGAGGLYTPPYPDRPEVAPGPLALLRIASRNLLAVWPQNTFTLPVFGHKVFNKTLLFVNSPEAVKQAFVDGAAAVQQKTMQQRAALAPLVGDGLFISHGETWRQRRKVVAAVTHASRMQELAEAISTGAWEQARAWRALPAGAEVDALGAMARLTAGIICATIFGRSLRPQSAQAVVSAFGVYQALIGQLDLLSLLGAPDVVPRLQGLRIRAAARRIHQVLDELIATALGDTGGGEAEAGEASLVRAMARTPLPGTDATLDRRAVRDEAAVLFLAGHEGVANTLAWAWFLLSQDTETERRLHAEVDAVLSDGPARYADMERLPFTRAVIEETLRLYPPIPIQARQASGPLAIAGRQVKKGDIVVLNAWTLHRHKLYWSDPDAFVPDRFMPGSPPPPRYAFVPFSIGPRICTGAAFGLAEAVLCLATLSHRFRLRLKPGHKVEPTCRLSLRPGKSLPMLVEARR